MLVQPRADLAMKTFKDRDCGRKGLSGIKRKEEVSRHELAGSAMTALDQSRSLETYLVNVLSRRALPIALVEMDGQQCAQPGA